MWLLEEVKIPLWLAAIGIAALIDVGVRAANFILSL